MALEHHDPNLFAEHLKHNRMSFAVERIDPAPTSNAPVRPVILIVAATSKAIVITLVLSQGERYLVHRAGIAVAIDSVMILLFFWYLLALRREATISPNVFTNLPMLSNVRMTSFRS